MGGMQAKGKSPGDHTRKGRHRKFKKKKRSYSIVFLPGAGVTEVGKKVERKSQFGKGKGG